MFGTDLESAYYDSVQTTYPSRENPYSHQKNPPDAVMQTPDEQPSTISQPTLTINDVIQQQPPTQPVATYDAPNPRMIPLYEQQLKNSNKIKELQLELLKQKQNVAPVNDPNHEPLYDRYISKKKDVFKLLNIAFTVLFAISLHFVLGDLIKSYLRNNDYSYNKETMIKFAYPLSVLLVLWSMKVFNK